MEILSKPVLFSEEHYGPIGLGVVTLNRPKALNALNIEMYKLIEPKLLAWENDPRIAAVVFESSSESVFSAGGDVKALVSGIQQTGIEVAKTFFTHEYFVDALTQSYSKPIVAFCDGFTMGGGLGLIEGSRFRLATQNSMFAMPEVAIGLFPDVGATRFLKKLKADFGLFLGLSGARIFGETALACGLADYLIDFKNIRKIRVDLLRLPWQPNPAANHQLLKQYFSNNQVKSSGETAFTEFQSIFNGKFLRPSFEEMDEQFRMLLKAGPELQDAANRYFAGSPTSRAVFLKAYQQHQGLDILETLCREWDMAISFSKKSEFHEGVRAVLIDKDQKPKWNPKTAAEVDVQGFFVSGEENLLRQKLLQHRRQIPNWS